MKGISVKVEMPDYKREFGITTFPDRKRPCLFLSRGAMIEPLAYFTTNEKAKQFKDVLERLIAIFKEEMMKQRMESISDELRLFIKDITLFLQKHSNYNPEKVEPMFQRAYKLYVKYDVENNQEIQRIKDRKKVGKCYPDYFNGQIPWDSDSGK